MAQIRIRVSSRLGDLAKRAQSAARASIEARRDMERVIEDVGERTLTRIRDQWPVDTGFSRRQWRFIRRGVLDYEWANSATYSSHVHYARGGSFTASGPRFGSPGITVRSTVVEDEVRAAIVQIRQRIMPIIEAALTGGAVASFVRRARLRL